MQTLEDLSVRVQNYKCFGDEAFGFEQLLPVNLIIGRNNSGKSSLLDILHYLTDSFDVDSLGHRGNKPLVILTAPLRDEELARLFPKDSSRSNLPVSNAVDAITMRREFVNAVQAAGYSTAVDNPWSFGQEWIGKFFSWSIDKGGRPHPLEVVPPFPDGMETYLETLAIIKGNPFKRHIFKRLGADRNILPEPGSAEIGVASDGSGATNTIQSFINHRNLPTELVQTTLLSELNLIFEPDSSFTSIVTQRDDHNVWEIYLEEEQKGRVALSHTGSGLKTILLVLVFIHLIPRSEGKSLSKYIFGFEELENNLHPALQRRLLLYLRRIALETGCKFFLTTHSNVAIDLFANDQNAQILHVTHDRETASVRPVHTYVENCGVLDDLDVRASDLLQANGIIWVEGPSDRLYLNRWLNLWSDGSLREGTHYQCVFYGGRLLAHLSAEPNDAMLVDAVRILRVNRNAILVMDSDRRASSTKLNNSKKRMLAEVSSMNGVPWVTAGREVENYIPLSILQRLYPAAKIEFGRYDDLAEYLDNIRNGEGKNFLRNKVLFAERVLPYFSKDVLEVTYDLQMRLNQMVNTIRRWNGLSDL